MRAIEEGERAVSGSCWKYASVQNRRIRGAARSGLGGKRRCEMSAVGGTAVEIRAVTIARRVSNANTCWRHSLMRKEIMSAHLPIPATCELSGSAGIGSLKHGVAEIGLGGLELVKMTMCLFEMARVRFEELLGAYES